jgi:hypothetical protein
MSLTEKLTIILTVTIEALLIIILLPNRTIASFSRSLTVLTSH